MKLNKFRKMIECFIISLVLSLLFTREVNSQQFNESEITISQDSLINSKSEIEDQKPFTAGLTFIYGYAIPHAKEVINIRGTNPKGYQVDFNWLLYSDETWNDCHCYPRLGFHLSFYDFDINEIFGYGYEGGINFTYFFGLLSKFNFFLQGKAGLSYLTRPYDKATHPENLSYSTHLNYLLSAGGGIRIGFSDYVESSFIISMNHNSNAAFLEPNGGINYPALSLALGYTFNPTELKPRNNDDSYLTDMNKKRLDFALFWGISGMPYPDEAQVPMYGINVVRSWQVTRIGAVTAGIELEMNGRANLLDNRGIIQNLSPWRGSVQAGWEFLMGRTIFSIQLGLYLYRPYKKLDDVYQRFGLVYKILDYLYAGINFKSYRHYADHLDFRIIFSF